ncbi:9786_t:CDS:2 [Racocetra persica]|uniref:9786_t:CDS:1 n=1 Tax=Racocetra persica TaxID=160502 RepID=A0ACA9LBU1_9GLOM|nr:9786_t:CDS:2 [Racocetra persica]
MPSVCSKYFETFPFDLCIKKSSKDPEIRGKVRQLLGTKKADIQELKNIWSKRNKKNVLKDIKNEVPVATNSKGTVTASAAQSKKRKTSDEEEWFNGLMRVASSLWVLVTAADTHNIAYLSGYIPDISVVDSADAEYGTFISSNVLTVLEIKRQKCVSGLTDEDKGQLLDYIYILVQQQPSRRLFSAFLSDGRFFYVMTFDKGDYTYKEHTMNFQQGLALFYNMICHKSSYLLLVED